MKNWLIISVYAIIEKDDQILLTEDEGNPGWKLPGGQIEKGELLLDGLAREIEEETDLDIQPTGLVSIQNYVRSDGTIRIRVYFTSKYVGGVIKHMPGEIRGSRWMSKKDLKKLKKEDFFIEQYFLAIREYLVNNVYPVSIVKELQRG